MGITAKNWCTHFFSLLACIILLNLVDAQPTDCRSGRNRRQCTSMSANMVEEAFDDPPCLPIRTLNGVCTNFAMPRSGVARAAHFSYFDDFSSTVFNDAGRQSARLISNVVSSQTSSKINRRGLTEFLVFFGQFLDHCVIQSKVIPELSEPIEVPSDDPVFANMTTIPFSRSERQTRVEEPTLEAPVNLLSSAVDLAAVYSSDEARLTELRVSGQSCFMKVSPGDTLPRNERDMVNEPTESEDFFLGGDVRANENLLITAFQVMFLREHNRWCNLLEPIFSDGETAFQEARKINIAQFQKIVFEEFYPAITGRQLPRWRFDTGTNPGVSVLFTTAAFRIGHTMIGNGLQLRGPGNSPLSSVAPRDMFFRTADVFESFGPEPLIRGSIQQRAQEVDTEVMDTIRQILFSNVPELREGIDLVAFNLQRGRDHALPSYNTVRNRFGLPALTSFTQVTSDRALQGKLMAVYNNPDEMDIWIALLAEDHEPGSSMGPTMLRIWGEEFRRLRDGDWLYYERRRNFLPETIENFPQLTQLKRQSNLMREIILRNTNISPSDLPGNVFKL